MTSFNDLLEKSCASLLDGEEIQELCKLAKSSGKAQEVLVKLLSTQTDASRKNLLAVRNLAKVPAPRAPVSEIRVIQELNQESEGFPFSLTIHCVERFAERHMTEQPVSETMGFLRKEAITATPIKKRTWNGQELWVSSSGILFVMKRDHGRVTCVTILPKDPVEGSRRRGSRHSRWCA